VPYGKTGLPSGRCALPFGTEDKDGKIRSSAKATEIARVGQSLNRVTKTNSQSRREMMKRLAVLFAVLFLVNVSWAEGPWDNFFHPRPPIHKLGLVSGETSALWEFKPTIEIAGTEIRKAFDGPGLESTFLNAVGPGLTYQHSNQDAMGVNYSDYSVSLAFLLTGNTSLSPSIQPAVAIIGGLENNLVGIGAGYELTKLYPAANRWFILMSFGVNLTLN
jgi:hypothetical protein